MECKTIGASMLCCLLLVASAGQGLATGASENKSCPADPIEAARILWPMKEAFAPQVRTLKAKHSCGQWLKCERRLKSVEWHCKWLGDKES